MNSTPLNFYVRGQPIARRVWKTLPRQKDCIILLNVIAKSKATFFVDRVTLAEQANQEVEINVHLVEVDATGNLLLGSRYLPEIPTS